MTKVQPIIIAFVVGVLVGVLAVVELVPPTAAQLATGLGDPNTAEPGGPSDVPQGPSDPGEGASEGPGSAAPGPAGPGSADGGAERPPDAGGPTSAPQPGPGSGAGGITCAAGRNGGATDRGVEAARILLATTVVESGIGSAFLGETRFAMEAVKNKVNREGGICGRRLEITYRDDGWDRSRGATFLRNFLDQGVFAIPVGPSSEGLNAVIDSGDFDRAQVPVVGTDGLIRLQYQRKDGAAQPWVWPVAAATVSSARIMANDAFDRMVAAGVEPTAADFSIVFDANYKFGEEGAEAFNAQVKRLTGDDIPGYAPGSQSCSDRFCGVHAGQSSYSSQVQAFNQGRFVALFLEPDTALKWMNDPNTPPAEGLGAPDFGYGAAQPLFTRRFAENCKTKCHGMVAWTGYKPFVEDYRSDPAVQQYVNDLRGACPSCDEANQFSQGAYIGMQLLVEAMREAGPDLTRQGLKQTLDGMSFGCGLCLRPALSFSPDNRYVATTMQGWVIQYRGTFAGWRAGNLAADPAFAR